MDDHGDVRDHKEMFAVTLILSDFPGHRDVGLAMLRERASSIPAETRSRPSALSSKVRKTSPIPSQT